MKRDSDIETLDRRIDDLDVRNRDLMRLIRDIQNREIGMMQMLGKVMGVLQDLKNVMEVNK